jgi:hypothetical protein
MTSKVSMAVYYLRIKNVIIKNGGIFPPFYFKPTLGRRSASKIRFPNDHHVTTEKVVRCKFSVSEPLPNASLLIP